MYVTVRRICYQALQDDGTIRILDGFIRDDPDLKTRNFPSQIAIEQNSSNACHVLGNVGATPPRLWALLKGYAPGTGLETTCSQLFFQRMTNFQ